MSVRQGNMVFKCVFTIFLLGYSYLEENYVEVVIIRLACDGSDTRTRRTHELQKLFYYYNFLS